MLASKEHTEDSLNGFESAVFLYGPTWDAASKVSKHHLAEYWASQGMKVLFVEAPFHLFSLLTRPQEVKRLWRRFTAEPRQIGPNLFITAAPILFPYRAGVPLVGTSVMLWLNQIIVRWKLRKACQQLGISRPLVVVGSATTGSLLPILDPSFVIYHCSDDYTRTPLFPKSYARLEQRLSAGVDLVVCTAEALRQVKASLNPHTYTVTNGAQIEHFSRVQMSDVEPAPELINLPKPVVGYIGTLFEWVDQDMIAFAAQKRTAWSFVLIGPSTADFSKLERMPNVYILGSRPYESLPSYLKGFDVATVPFVVHDVTLRASPVKFYEYLASGIPVVATRLPDLEQFSQIVSLVSSPQEFLEGVEYSIYSENASKRLARMGEANNHSWDSRFKIIDSLVKKIYEQRNAANNV